MTVADSGLSSSLSRTNFTTYSIYSFNFAYYYPEQLLQVDPNILSQDIYMFF
jgi:hypothetical protein